MMTKIDPKIVQRLRSESGAGVMDCKRALEETGGDYAKALALIKERGIQSVAKKSDREAKEGLVASYIHGNGRIGALVELASETDFVSRGEDFRQLAQEIAMQVAAMNPRYVRASSVPEQDWASLESEFGDRKKAAEAVCLYEQAFIRDPKVSIEELIRETVAKLGENIQVQRFARFEVGADRAGADAEE